MVDIFIKINQDDQIIVIYQTDVAQKLAQKQRVSIEESELRDIFLWASNNNLSISTDKPINFIHS